MCSVAFSRAHRQQVSVPAGSSKLISYAIIPLKTGELPLQVTAIARSFIEADTVRKNLRVVVEGIQRIKSRSFVLNPSEKGDSGRQVIKVEKMELKSVVPNSKPKAFVNVRGDLLADSIDNSIKEDSLAALIRMPGGCVEQNLARITLPLIAAHYLDRSGNWNAVGIDRRQEAIKYIQTGYENQLNYRKKDDSYPPYAKEGTSTWITAYVVKVFSMVKSFININDKNLCGPLVYLLKNKQHPDGSFQEDNPVYDTSMMGGLQGSESRVSLTAFVLIALAEAQNALTCQEPGLNIQGNSSKAVEYLRQNFPRLKRPYTVAIACYALAVSNHGCMKSMLLKFASTDRTHWTDSDNRFFTLEATGYALLALIKGGHMKEAVAPFQWLNEHRDIGGGYGSTQSTMVVLQALSEYLVKRPPPSKRTLRVELHVPGDRITLWNFLPKMVHGVVHIYPFTSAALTSIDGTEDKGYGKLPPQAVAVHLCPLSALGLKAHAVHPSKPCRTTSSLEGRAYSAAGQAGSVLHMIPVLQVFQAILFRTMDNSGSNSDAFKEQAIGKAMASLVML
ncbi:complement C3-like [Sinocyclocheilus grahami]|uniref:complement C3-like n=1 Tax=Sinocyclocheilus grahami TaxID=75366 RepID=UPI0007AC8BA7|nr:PREDICTED: complement C3-like [Sinocyclocheilus grahami]